MPLRTFKHLRAGLETVRGTGVAMTRGIEFTSGNHIQSVEHIYPEQIRGSYFAHYSSQAGTETNSLEIETAVDFDILPWWFNLHIDTVASGTGGAADKTWVFTPASTADELKTATVQFGYTDSIAAGNPGVSLTYVIGDELTLMWDKTPGAPGVNLRSRLVSPKAATQISAFTGTGTYTTSELAKANATVITIDPTTIGSTADNDIVSAEWTLRDGTVNLYTMNNTTAAQDTLRPNPWDWELRLVRYIRNDNEWDRYLDKAKRKIRIKSTGSALGGSAYSLTLDCYGVIETRTTSENDGLGFEELTYRPLYDTGAATDFLVTVVCATSAIT